MTISRMQQRRQMYQRGGIMEVAPRQGAIFGGLKKAVSSALGSAKKLLKSDLGKAALLGVGAFGLPGGALGMKGLMSSPAVRSFIPNLLLGKEVSGSGMMGRSGDGLLGMFSNMGNFGKAATMFGIGALGGGALAALEAAGIEDPEQVGNVDALKEYLAQGYKQLNPIGDKDPEVYQAEVDQFVTANTAEYRADGGRIGFADGMPREGIETLLPKPKPSEMMQEVDSVTQSVDNFAQLIAQSGDPSSFRGHVDLLSEFIQKNDIDPSAAFDYVKRRVDEIKPGLSKFIFTTTEDMPVEKKAYGGRIGYSGGTKGPDDLYTRSYKRVMELMDEGYDFGSAVKKYMEEEKERENKSYGGRMGFEDGTPKSLLDMIKIEASGSKSGKQQISGAPEGFTIDKETFNAILKADIPLSEKIDFLASYQYGKGRDRIEKDNQELFLGEGGFKDRNIGLGFNKDGEGFGGTLMYNMETGKPEFKGTFKKSFAEGGRLGYAFGNPEQNAINAAGIMDLPLNQNPAGITELDLRDSGGFIPPVGVKEKADDIPAMLSNNEFVFTADAVRGMGDGDVNKGAQRMYDMMKKLEGGGRV